MKRLQQTPSRDVGERLDTRVPLVMWSTSAGSLLGIDAAVFMRIDGVNRVHDVAALIGETQSAVAESIARLESRGLLTFLPDRASIVAPGATEYLEEITDLIEIPAHESVRDTLPEVPSAQLVEACALDERALPPRPPPLPARARSRH